MKHLLSTRKGIAFSDARSRMFNHFISGVGGILLTLLLFSSAAVAQGTWCTSSCFDRTTDVDGQPGIYICASSTLPSCVSSPSGCDSA